MNMTEGRKTCSTFVTTNMQPEIFHRASPHVCLWVIFFLHYLHVTGNMLDLTTGSLSFFKKNVLIFCSVLMFHSLLFFTITSKMWHYRFSDQLSNISIFFFIFIILRLLFHCCASSLCNRSVLATTEFHTLLSPNLFTVSNNYKKRRKIISVGLPYSGDYSSSGAALR